jgi:hypothetical protein
VLQPCRDGLIPATENFKMDDFEHFFLSSTIN